MGILSMLGGMGGLFGGCCYLEHLVKGWLASYPLAARLFGPSALLGGVVPALYGGVVLVNVFGSSMLMMRLSFIPGGARKKFIEKAKKEGDDHAEERFSLPKLYAEGFTPLAKHFNCHQRAHQQALETYPSFVACSIIGGIRQVS